MYFTDDNTQPDDQVFQENLSKHQDAEITEEIQERLNEPLAKDVKPKYKEYLKTILDLIENKQINLFLPSTFLNQEIYDGLSEEAKGAVDITLVNLADKIKQLQYLVEKDLEDSFQLESMVDDIWYTKERIESVHGDVYKV